jgi:hypothetical protein
MESRLVILNFRQVLALDSKPVLVQFTELNLSFFILCVPLRLLCVLCGKTKSLTAKVAKEVAMIQRQTASVPKTEKLLAATIWM